MNSDLFDSPSGPSSSGGSIEPERQTRAPTSASPGVGERFELRDRVANVIHQASTFSEMAAKAEELGSTLFVAVAADGKRTSIQKVDGHWQRGPQRPASSARPALRVEPAGAASARHEVAEPAKVQPKTPSEPAAATQPVAARTPPRVEAKAERELLIANLEAGLSERYIVRPAPVTVGDLTIGRTEYRFRGDSSRVAFTESNMRLATDNNSPSVARSMVDVAQARGWRALRVSGHEDFKRLIWLEASVRGLKALGYEPSPQDLALLQREREARLVNRIEPADDAAAAGNDAARGGGGRKTVLAAIEALLVANKVPEKQRVAVMAAATEKLAQLISQGQTPRVKIYDVTAPSRASAMAAPDIQGTPDRSAPAPQR